MEWCNYVSSQLSCPAHESMLVCFIEIQLNSTVSPHIILCFTVRWALERSPAILFVRILKISSIVESLSNVFSPLHLNYPFNKKQKTFHMRTTRVLMQIPVSRRTCTNPQSIYSEQKKKREVFQYFSHLAVLTRTKENIHRKNKMPSMTQ